MDQATPTKRRTIGTMLKAMLQRGKTIEGSEVPPPSNTPADTSHGGAACVNLAEVSKISEGFIVGAQEEHKEANEDTKTAVEATDISLKGSTINESSKEREEIQEVMEMIMLAAVANERPVVMDEVQGLRDQLNQIEEAQRESKRSVFPSTRQVTFSTEARYCNYS